MQADFHPYNDYEVPLLHVLRSQLRVRALGSGGSMADHRVKLQVLERELEQLPYNVGGALSSLRQIETLVRQLPELVRAGVPPEAVRGGVVGLIAHQTMPLCWTVDQFLDTSRRAQNALTRYVARTFDTSLPQSLADFVSKGHKYKENVPGDVMQLLSEYWLQHGDQLKAYRDLAQHYAVVSSDAYVYVESDDTCTMHLLLPTNPKERSLARICYDAPHVPVTSYCRQAFVELLRLSCSLTYLLLTYVGAPNQVTLSLLRHPMSLRGVSGFLPVPSSDLDHVIHEAKRTSAEWSRTAFGELQTGPTRGVTA